MLIRAFQTQKEVFHNALTRERVDIPRRTSKFKKLVIRERINEEELQIGIDLHYSVISFVNDSILNASLVEEKRDVYENA